MQWNARRAVTDAALAWGTLLVVVPLSAVAYALLRQVGLTQRAALAVSCSMMIVLLLVAHTPVRLYIQKRLATIVGADASRRFSIGTWRRISADALLGFLAAAIGTTIVVMALLREDLVISSLTLLLVVIESLLRRLAAQKGSGRKVDAQEDYVVADEGEAKP